MNVIILQDDDGDVMATLVVNDDQFEHYEQTIKAQMPPNWTMEWHPVETLQEFLDWIDEQ